MNGDSVQKTATMLVLDLPELKEGFVVGHMTPEANVLTPTDQNAMHQTAEKLDLDLPKFKKGLIRGRTL